MSSLPEEIYLDILLRVPVKSTYACKCVCKTWFHIISESDFVNLHLNRTIKTNSCSLMLETRNPYGIHSVSYDSLTSSNGFDGDVAVADMDLPHECSYKNIELLGSCNGLVYGWNHQLNLYFLWNPATKEHRKLPETQYAYYYHYCKLHGFGYDYKNGDYMLVIADKIYSLKSNSWESFQSIESCHVFESSGVFFKGSLHWLLSIGEEYSRMIVSIDISEKRYKEVSPPTTQYNFMNMGVLEGCLCALVYSRETQETFEVWVMQDYGVPESWTKLHTITFDSAMPTYCRLYYSKIVGSLPNGEILFKNDYMDNVAHESINHNPSDFSQ